MDRKDEAPVRDISKNIKQGIRDNKSSERYEQVQNILAEFQRNKIDRKRHDLKKNAGTIPTEVRIQHHPQWTGVEEGDSSATQVESTTTTKRKRERRTAPTKRRRTPRKRMKTMASQPEKRRENVATLGWYCRLFLFVLAGAGFLSSACTPLPFALPPSLQWCCVP